MGFSCLLKGKEAPYIKNLGGQGLPGGGGGSAWEVSVEILYVYALFGGLTTFETIPNFSGISRRSS